MSETKSNEPQTNGTSANESTGPSKPFGLDTFGLDTKALEQTFDELFATWEKRTSDYFERLMRNPTFLNTVGNMMNFGYKNKITLDRAFGNVWKNLNLPNKRDQERTLHLLNELHGRIQELEEKLETLKTGAPDKPDSATPRNASLEKTVLEKTSLDKTPSEKTPKKSAVASETRSRN